MTLEEYRRVVRQMVCPDCEAQPGEPCSEFYPPPPGGPVAVAPTPVDYVHDDRALAYLRDALAYLHDRLI